jgi:hypothetical protein
MIIKTATRLAFAVACVTSIVAMPAAKAQMTGYPGGTEVVTNGPQGSTPPNWSPQQNVMQSRQYDQLLETNRAFRQSRIQKECGPVTDPQLHASCVASFGRDEPLAGSAASRRRSQ